MRGNQHTSDAETLRVTNAEGTVMTATEISATRLKIGEGCGNMVERLSRRSMLTGLASAATATGAVIVTVTGYSKTGIFADSIAVSDR